MRVHDTAKTPGSNTGGYLKGEEELSDDGYLSWGLLNAPDAKLRVRCDWLTFSVQGWEPNPENLRATLGYLGLWCQGAEIRPGKPLNGYQQALQVVREFPFGTKQTLLVCFGGVQMRNRVMFQIEGAACLALQPAVCARLVSWLETFNGRITRVDLACDDLGGSMPIEAIRERAATTDDFACKGPRPSIEIQGDWDEPGSPRGRTVYIGRRPKRMCIYEKGKEQGDTCSPWVRWELRLSHDKLKPIPLDVLLRQVEFFAGSYEPCAELVQVAGEVVRAETLKARVRLDAQMSHLRRSYGSILWVLNEVVGDPAAVMRMLMVPGLPASLQEALEGLPVDEWRKRLAVMAVMSN